MSYYGVYGDSTHDPATEQIHYTDFSWLQRTGYWGEPGLSATFCMEHGSRLVSGDTFPVALRFQAV